MNEAVFRFRASGEVDISSLEITYVGGTPAEEWCNPPYVVPVFDEAGNLYELHFRLEPFILNGGGASVRKCVVTGPIYIIPDYTHAVINVNLTITQQACVEELSCDELANLINVFPNSDVSIIPCDGGDLGMVVDTGGYFDVADSSAIYESDGVTPCTWARFDSSHNVIYIDRRGFDALGGSNRTCIVVYNFVYSAPYDIDKDPCEVTYEAEIEQAPRLCSEADITACVIGTNCSTDLEFSGDGERDVNIENFIGTNGYDANAFQITNIYASGDAFRQYDPIVHGANGWILYLVYNTDIYYKYGILQVEYTNQYDTTCIKTFEFNVKLDGITCSDAKAVTQFGIQIDNEPTFYYNGTSIQLDGRPHTVTISIIGDYANYFDIDEDESNIPFQLVPGSNNVFYIPANDDPTSSVEYIMSLVASVSDAQYEQSTIFGCTIESNYSLVQNIQEEIETIGDINETVTVECDEVGDIPAIITDYRQEGCSEINLSSTETVSFGQACGSPVILESSQDVSFKQPCVTPITLKSTQSVSFTQTCGSIQASITGNTTHSQTCT